MRLFVAKNPSARFMELWANERRSLDIDQFEACLNEWKVDHEGKGAISFIASVLLFVAGLWATYENIIFLAVFLLSLAYITDQKSSHHLLMLKVLNSQRILAMFINEISRRKD